MHRAEAQRRSERQDQIFVALSRENRFKLKGPYGFNRRSRILSWVLCVFAPLRENFFYGIAKDLWPGLADQVSKG